jgi:Domain of unknown function (DUF4160)
MPQIARFSNCKVCIYADDEFPPHFHVVGKGWEVKVRLETLEVMVGKGCRADIAEALEWAATNMDHLRREWNRLNERD